MITEEELLEDLDIDSVKDSSSQSLSSNSKRFQTTKDKRNSSKVYPIPQFEDGKRFEEEEKKFPQIEISKSSNFSSNTSESSSLSSSQSSSQGYQRTVSIMHHRDAGTNFLDLSPPNFMLAEIHQSANKVKDIDAYEGKEFSRK